MEKRGFLAGADGPADEEDVRGGAVGAGLDRDAAGGGEGVVPGRVSERSAASYLRVGRMVMRSAEAPRAVKRSAMVLVWMPIQVMRRSMAAMTGRMRR